VAGIRQWQMVYARCSNQLQQLQQQLLRERTESINCVAFVRFVVEGHHTGASASKWPQCIITRTPMDLVDTPLTGHHVVTAILFVSVAVWHRLGYMTRCIPHAKQLLDERSISRRPPRKSIRRKRQLGRESRTGRTSGT